MFENEFIRNFYISNFITLFEKERLNTNGFTKRQISNKKKKNMKYKSENKYNVLFLTLYYDKLKQLKRFLYY